MKQSGGHIWVYSEPGRGSTFKMYFPRVDAAADVPAFDAAPPPSGDETILLVEDSESLREVTAEFLRVAGYRVIEAADSEIALRVAREYRDAIHLLLTDVVLPGMSGPELSDEVLRLHPETRTLFMTGYTSEAIVHRGILDDGLSLLTKPFTRSALTQKVHDMLHAVAKR